MLMIEVISSAENLTKNQEQDSTWHVKYCSPFLYSIDSFMYLFIHLPIYLFIYLFTCMLINSDSKNIKKNKEQVEPQLPLTTDMTTKSGPRFSRKMALRDRGISIIYLKWSWGRFIFIMGVLVYASSYWDRPQEDTYKWCCLMHHSYPLLNPFLARVWSEALSEVYRRWSTLVCGV